MVSNATVCTPGGMHTWAGTNALCVNYTREWRSDHDGGRPIDLCKLRLRKDGFIRANPPSIAISWKGSVP